MSVMDDDAVLVEMRPSSGLRLGASGLFGVLAVGGAYVALTTSPIGGIVIAVSSILMGLGFNRQQIVVTRREVRVLSAYRVRPLVVPSADADEFVWVRNSRGQKRVVLHRRDGRSTPGVFLGHADQPVMDAQLAELNAALPSQT